MTRIGRPVRRYTPRRRRSDPIDEATAAALERQSDQLARRLRLAVDRGDPLYSRIVRACDVAAKLAPAERRAALQEFAREIRPQLDEDAATYAVPDWMLAAA